MLEQQSPPASLALDTIRRERERRLASKEDVADWAARRFYIKGTKQPIKLVLHQAGVLRYLFQRDPIGRLLRATGIYSTVKKSGKSTVGALVARWYAETQTALGEVYCLANDWKQAKERNFRMVEESIRLTPGCVRRSNDWVLPGEWRVQRTVMECLTTGTKIEALPIDPSGEAGAAPDLTVWTELHGSESEAAHRFWDEMTPVLTRPNSYRFVETYAGYSGDSALLEELYDLGRAGRQLTNHEFAEVACRPDVLGESYDDFLWAFFETEGDPEALLPIWTNEPARLAMYWDSGLNARRMPWQRGPEAVEYYAGQELTLTAVANTRLHYNDWAQPEGDFVPMPLWDACQEALPPLSRDEALVVAVDAATTGDCFGIVGVTRHPDRPQDPAIRAVKKWTPPKGGAIDYDQPEGFLRWLFLGGCAMGHPLKPDKSTVDPRFSVQAGGRLWKTEDCPACLDNQMVAKHKVTQICFDNFQLVDMMQRLVRELNIWCEPFDQGAERLKGDRQFYDLVMQRRLAHDGNAELREHVANAAAKMEKQEDSKMRMIKKTAAKKIDLAVAAAMGTHRCLYLMLAPSRPA